MAIHIYRLWVVLGLLASAAAAPTATASGRGILQKREPTIPIASGSTPVTRSSHAYIASSIEKRQQLFSNARQYMCALPAPSHVSRALMPGMRWT